MNLHEAVRDQIAEDLRQRGFPCTLSHDLKPLCDDMPSYFIVSPHATVIIEFRPPSNEIHIYRFGFVSIRIKLALPYGKIINQLADLWEEAHD